MNEHIAEQRPAGLAFERHYSVQEISKLWGFGVDVVRRIFNNVPGVVKLSHPETLHKRGYTTLRVPDSVMRRVHRQLTTTTGKPI